MMSLDARTFTIHFMFWSASKAKEFEATRWLASEGIKARNQTDNHVYSTFDVDIAEEDMAEVLDRLFDEVKVAPTSIAWTGQNIN